ncbi:MAG TPA: ABC transporter permease [Gemmatimonadaceae bacterium]|nr:ABC transporter permease [Gemmatimonadaceae bacterium]
MLGIRSALRSLCRAPAFSSLAVATLALALALGTTTFAMLDSLAHPYLPFRDPERLFQVYPNGDGARRDATLFEKYAVLRDDPEFHGRVAGFSFAFAGLRVRDAVREELVAQVTPNFFEITGVSPALGRGLTARDAEEGGTALISHELWRRIGAGRTSLQNVTVTIDERTYTVVGVMPQGMREPWRTQVWLPMAASAERTGTDLKFILPLLRLPPGATPQTIEPRLSVLAARLAHEHGEGRWPFRYVLRRAGPGPETINRFHAALAGAAMVVLLIACANLAHLMLARGLARRRELALRVALGASRWALVRQLLSESALISFAGGITGLIAASWSVSLVATRIPADLLHTGAMPPTLSWRDFLFCLLATMVTILLAGLWPALRASDAPPDAPLKDGSGTTTGRHSRRYSALVIGQVALSLSLLMATGLLIRAAQRVSGFDFGFDTRHLLGAMTMFPRGSSLDSASVSAAYRRLLDGARSDPAVRSVATMHAAVPDGSSVISESRGGGSQRLYLRAYRVVSPAFLRTIGVRLLRGRDFVAGDALAGGAAIVDVDAASRLWPHEDPVGRMLKLGDEQSPAPWVRVVGIAHRANMRFSEDPDLEPEPEVYVVRPGMDAAPFRLIAARSASNDGATALALWNAIHAAAPTIASARISSWLQSFDDEVRAHRFAAGLFALYGAFALTLCAVGLYGVLSYAVRQRMRELGVRAALGARSPDLVRLVLRDALVMVLSGTAVGAILAMWSARLLGAWLYGVAPTDAVSLVSAEVVLFGVALGACVAPARHAMRADPMDVLRAT